MSLGAQAGKALAWRGVEPLESRMLMSANLLFSDYQLSPEMAASIANYDPTATPSADQPDLFDINELTIDDALMLDPTASDPNLAATSGSPSLAAATTFSSTGVPIFHSNPGAAATLYLDFDGDTTTTWGSYSNIVTPAFSIDSDPNFSSTELTRMSDIWARVSEDYAPFNIDVTTENPGSFNNKQALRVDIGGDGAWLGSAAGGVAYTYTFTNSIINTVYVFPQMLGNGTAKYVADAASHEAGHAFGLEHQSTWSGSTKTAEYNPGGSGWAPLMGNSYSQALSTWYNGINASHTAQDDMSIIASSMNGFGYRADDHGDTDTTGDALTIASNGTTISGSGIIEQPSDIDDFDFTSGAGPLSITVNVASLGANLDSVLSLFDDSGNLIVTANPSNSLNATISTSVNAGNYHLQVTSVDTYGYVGQYSLTGSITAPDTTPPPPPVVGPAIGVTLSGSTLTDGSTIDFGTFTQNTAAPSKTFTVTNSGDQTLTLGSLQLPTGFTITNNLVSSLAPGASDTFTIQMSTATVATRSGTLTFATNDPANTSMSFTLTGIVQAIAPAIGVTLSGTPLPNGSTVDFGEATQNSAAPSRTFTVTNSGGQTLTLGALQIPAGFSVTDDLVSALAPGASDTFTVIMSTDTIASLSDSLTFTTNDPSDATVTFDLVGDVLTASDAYESNDSKAEVDALTPGDPNSANLGNLTDPLVINHLNTADGTEDWFSFTMNGFGTLDNNVRIDFDNGLGDLDLVVYRADGTTIVASSLTTSDSEIVTLSGMAPGTYYARITGFQGARSPDYTLTINPATDGLTVNSTGRQTFNDTQGTPVTVTYRGAGEVSVLPNLLTGDLDVTVTGSDSLSTLTIVTAGRGSHTSLGNVTITGSLGNFSAPTSDLHGTFTAAGTVRRLTLNDVGTTSQQLISIGSSVDDTTPIIISLGDVTDMNIASQTPIATLSVHSWTDAADTPDEIDAPRIVSLLSDGDFGAGLNLTGDVAAPPTLRRASIAGIITGGLWNITGDVGSIVAASTDAAWQLSVTGKVAYLCSRSTMAGELTAGTFGTIRSRGDFSASLTATAANLRGESLHQLLTANVLGSAISVLGRIQTIRVDSWTEGSISAAALGTITATDDFTTQIDATDAAAEISLVRLTVGGTLSASTIRTASAIGSVSVGAMDGSHLFVGVAQGVTDLPETLDDFDALSSINSLRVRGLPKDPTPAFRNSFVAAFNLRVLRLGQVQTQNGGTPFGVATHSFTRINYSDTPDSSGHHTLTPVADTTPDNDFIIRVV